MKVLARSKKQKATSSYLLFIIIQIVLIVLFVTAIIQRRPVSQENTDTVSFIVDNVEKVDLFTLNNHTNEKIYLYNDSDRYIYGLDKSPKNLENTFLNKKLTVMYEKETNIAVDIRGEDTVFYTIDDYNKQQKSQLLFGIIGLSVFELLLIVFFYIYLLIFK